MGYWISYLGVGYGGELRPYFGDGGVLLFALPVVIAGLLVPALCAAGLRLDARAALRAVRAGARAGRADRDDGRLPRGHAASQSVELHVQPLPSGPVPAHDLQGRPAGRARAWRSSPACGRRAPRERLLFVVLAVVACWPLVRGQAIDDQLPGTTSPRAWQQAADHVDADASGTAAPSSCPASCTPTTTGAGRSTRSSRRSPTKPVATRNAVGYADLRATDLLWTVDALVQQRRAVPGPAGPAAGPDERAHRGRRRRRRPRPQRRRPAPRRPTPRPARQRPSALGAPRAACPAAGRSARRRAAAGARVGSPGRARPGAASSRSGRRPVVDGSAKGSPPPAALGRPGRPPTPADARRPDADPPRRAEVVITDSNRRRVLRRRRGSRRTSGRRSPRTRRRRSTRRCSTRSASGRDAQTVAVYDGIEAVRAPSSPGFPQFPEHGRSRRSTATRRRTGRPTARWCRAATRST